jgi:DNA-binding beta-propeller fold protein YncE
VFVTGASNGVSSYDYATVAYDTQTGTQLWVDRYNGPGNGDDEASSVAVSGDGTKVYVTGGSDGRFTGSDYATLAYSAATGAQLWLRPYTGPGDGSDIATSMAVSPTTNKLFVTGISPGWPGGTAGGYATVAYSG